MARQINNGHGPPAPILQMFCGVTGRLTASTQRGGERQLPDVQALTSLAAAARCFIVRTSAAPTAAIGVAAAVAMIVTAKRIFMMDDAGARTCGEIQCMAHCAHIDIVTMHAIAREISAVTKPYSVQIVQRIYHISVQTTWWSSTVRSCSLPACVLPPVHLSASDFMYEPKK